MLHGDSANSCGDLTPLGIVVERWSGLSWQSGQLVQSDFIRNYESDECLMYHVSNVCTKKLVQALLSVPNQT